MLVIAMKRDLEHGGCEYVMPREVGQRVRLCPKERQTSHNNGFVGDSQGHWWLQDYVDARSRSADIIEKALHNKRK